MVGCFTWIGWTNLYIWDRYEYIFLDIFSNFIGNFKIHLHTFYSFDSWFSDFSFRPGKRSGLSQLGSPFFWHFNELHGCSEKNNCRHCSHKPKRANCGQETLEFRRWRSVTHEDLEIHRFIMMFPLAFREERGEAWNSFWTFDLTSPMRCEKHSLDPITWISLIIFSSES